MCIRDSLWIEHKLPTKAVLIVTHNIEEAVLMCDHKAVSYTHLDVYKRQASP